MATARPSAVATSGGLGREIGAGQGQSAEIRFEVGGAPLHRGALVDEDRDDRPLDGRDVVAGDPPERDGGLCRPIAETQPRPRRPPHRR